jgi:hypothetical protein
MLDTSSDDARKGDCRRLEEAGRRLPPPARPSPSEKEIDLHVFQCPKCQLRFPSSAELKEHLTVDHPEVNVEPKGDRTYPSRHHRTRAL